MQILEIQTYGAAVLRKKAQEITEITPDIHDLIAKMIHTMKEAPGIGLAAPQVNVSKRLVIVTFGLEDNRPEIKALINPEITWHGKSDEIMEEGCLSVPDVNSDVSRWTEIQLKALDENGETLDLHLTGLTARIVQHELDHLDGILFVDRLPPLRQDIIKRKLKKQLKRTTA